MAWTQTDLDAIETAIAKGERLVRFNDRTVEYRSVAELLTARDAIKSDLTQQSNSTRRPRMFRVRTSRAV